MRTERRFFIFILFYFFVFDLFGWSDRMASVPSSPYQTHIPLPSHSGTFPSLSFLGFFFPSFSIIISFFSNHQQFHPIITFLLHFERLLLLLNKKSNTLFDFFFLMINDRIIVLILINSVYLIAAYRYIIYCLNFVKLSTLFSFLFPFGIELFVIFPYRLLTCWLILGIFFFLSFLHIRTC